MSTTVKMPVEPIGSGRWTSLAEAEKEVRQWAQKHVLHELILAYESTGKLISPPSSYRDWYWISELFDGSWDEADPIGEYHDWKEDAWRAYKDSVLFAWDWVEQAIQLIEKDRECAHEAHEQVYLDRLPKVDPELLDEYRHALRKICRAMKD